jgi:hypothetical protein
MEDDIDYSFRNRLFLVMTSIVFFFYIGTGVAHAEISPKTVDISAVGDGSFNVDITSDVLDSCLTSGSGTTTYTTFGLTGGGGTTWTIPTPAATSVHTVAFPIANQDFSALQEQCAAVTPDGGLLIPGPELKLLKIGFPLFHTGLPSGGETVNTYGVGAGNSGDQTSPYGGTQGYVGFTAAGEYVSWAGFVTTTNVGVITSATLSFTVNSAFGGARTVDVYQMNAHGDAAGSWNKYDATHNWGGSTPYGSSRFTPAIGSVGINGVGTYNVTLDPTSVANTINTGGVFGIFDHDQSGSARAIFDPTPTLTLNGGGGSPSNDYVLTPSALALYYATSTPACNNAGVIERSLCQFVNFVFVPQPNTISELTVSLDSLSGKVPFGFWKEAQVPFTTLNTDGDTTSTDIVFHVPIDNTTTTVVIFSPSSTRALIPPDILLLMKGIEAVFLWGAFFWWLVELAVDHKEKL